MYFYNQIYQGILFPILVLVLSEKIPTRGVARPSAICPLNNTILKNINIHNLKIYTLHSNRSLAPLWIRHSPWNIRCNWTNIQQWDHSENGQHYTQTSGALLKYQVSFQKLCFWASRGWDNHRYRRLKHREPLCVI